MTLRNNHYDVAIIGGGVSGTALLYILAKYSTVKRVVLLERYAAPGQVNSQARNNSQTLHTGDIETNYSPERAAQVRPASLMVDRYCQALPAAARAKILRTVPKMILGVGAAEVALLKARYSAIHPIFPELQCLTGPEIATVEPAVMAGRDPSEPIIALYNPQGQAVDFGQLAASFVEQTHQTAPNFRTLFSHPVTRIYQDTSSDYCLVTPHGQIRATTVIVDADAHSLGFAKQLGYGQEYSLIPMAGTFFFSPNYLRGKVYTCQNTKLLYTAIHGDPDLSKPNVTRWGPTVRFFPVLERGQWRTVIPYFKTAGLGRLAAWQGFITILKDPDRGKFFGKNILYEIPWLGRYLFAQTVRKVCPTIKTTELQRARGYGGMRLQRVNIHTQELEVGERKIIGERIIFNMTPSPGASICLYNAFTDAQKIIQFLNGQFTLDTARLQHDLLPTPPISALQSVVLK